MHFQLATLALFVLSGITNALPNPGETPTGYGGTTTSTWGTTSTCTPSTGYSYSTGYSTYSTVSVTTIPSTSYSTVCIQLPPSLASYRSQTPLSPHSTLTSLLLLTDNLHHNQNSPPNPHPPHHLLRNLLHHHSRRPHHFDLLHNQNFHDRNPLRNDHVARKRCCQHRDQNFCRRVYQDGGSCGDDYADWYDCFYDGGGGDDDGLCECGGYG